MTISGTSRDHDTGYRTGRCGNWFVRVRRDGVTFDLARPPFEGWEEAKSEFIGLTIDQASRLLEIPRGDLYDWGKR